MVDPKTHIGIWATVFFSLPWFSWPTMLRYVLCLALFCHESHHITSSFCNNDVSAYCQPHSVIHCSSRQQQIACKIRGCGFLNGGTRLSGCCCSGSEEYLNHLGFSSYGCTTPYIPCSWSPKLWAIGSGEGGGGGSSTRPGRGNGLFRGANQ